MLRLSLLLSETSAWWPCTVFTATMHHVVRSVCTFKQAYALYAAVAGYLESLRYFRAAANALSETDDETFTGIVSAPAFALALNSIRESYANPHSFLYRYLCAKPTTSAGQPTGNCRYFTALLRERNHQLSQLKSKWRNTQCQLMWKPCFM